MHTPNASNTYYTHSEFTTILSLRHSLVNLQITQGDTGGAHEVISCQITVVYLSRQTQQETVHTESVKETITVMVSGQLHRCL